MSEFQIRSVPHQDTAVVAVSTKPDAIGEAMSEALPRAYAAVTAAGAVPAGAPFSRYYLFEEKKVDFEAGVPVASPFAGDGEVKAGELGADEAAVTMHVGSYDTIGQTWDALWKWIEDQGRKPAGPGWESYLTEPSAEPDPAMWQTEIIQPIE